MPLVLADGLVPKRDHILRVETKHGEIIGPVTLPYFEIEKGTAKKFAARSKRNKGATCPECGRPRYKWNKKWVCPPLLNGKCGNNTVDTHVYCLAYWLCGWFCLDSTESTEQAFSGRRWLWNTATNGTGCYASASQSYFGQSYLCIIRTLASRSTTRLLSRYLSDCSILAYTSSLLWDSLSYLLVLWTCWFHRGTRNYFICGSGRGRIFFHPSAIPP
jgi:hypothetical protein